MWEEIEKSGTRSGADVSRKRSCGKALRRFRRNGTGLSEREPPLFVPFYNPRMQISGSKGPVGGAMLAHWSGEKEACISPDPDICTRGAAIFPFTQSLEGDSAAPLGVVLQQ